MLLAAAAAAAVPSQVLEGINQDLTLQDLPWCTECVSPTAGHPQARVVTVMMMMRIKLIKMMRIKLRRARVLRRAESNGVMAWWVRMHPCRRRKWKCGREGSVVD